MNTSPAVPEPSVGLVVIGGGPAGHSAAAGYRDAGGRGRVLIISADEAPPYQRPPLSKEFLRGESGEQELPLVSAAFYRDNGIELWLAQTVSRLDPDGRTVTTSTQRIDAFDNGDGVIQRSGNKLPTPGGQSLVGYRSCVLAMGCRPAVLPVPGADHRDVLHLRSIADARVLRKAAGDAQTAVVVGSGFIGCEVAMSLATRGLTVTVLSSEVLPQLTRLGRAAANRIAGWLAEAGVRLVTGVEVSGIRAGREVTANGSVYSADLVLVAAGVNPNSDPAAEAGLLLQDGRIVVDERMATAIPGVFAAGDVALARNATVGRALRVEHWGEALRMGEIAGINAAGGNDKWSEVPGCWSEIGERTLKYAAWGDGFDSDELIERPDGGFSVRYSKAGRTVGVLTHRADDDYDSGRQLIAEQA